MLVIVQLWKRYKTGATFNPFIAEFHHCMCPVCAGNDKLVGGPEAPGFSFVHCERCDEWFFHGNVKQ